MDDNYNAIPDHSAEYESADFTLIQDIINSDKIDIVLSYSVDPVKYEILREKGAFIDLYTFMQNDNEVNKNTLNNHILSLNEKDGKLYGLPISYKIKTLLGYADLVGTKENWTLDEFFDAWKNAPENATIAGTCDKLTTYRTILYPNTEYFESE